MRRMPVKHLVAGEFAGRALVSAHPLSFFGDIDVRSGTVVTQASDLLGRSISDLVLCLPFTHGSAGAWRVLQQLRTHGTAPLALVVRDLPDPSVVQGAILIDLPTIRLLDPADFALLTDGAHVGVDKATGWLELP